MVVSVEMVAFDECLAISKNITVTITTAPMPTARPPRSAEREALIDRIVAGTAAIAGHQRCAAARRLHQQGISMAHLQTLWILQDHGPQPVTHLADLLGVAVPNATGIIDRMEQRGLVERGRDGADRRVVIVRQTRDGAQAVEEMDGWRSEMLQSLLDRLDTDQLVRLVDGVDDLRETIRIDEVPETSSARIAASPRGAESTGPTEEIARP
jgi:DNA-binding MarR family transcriptional regulator